MTARRQDTGAGGHSAYGVVETERLRLVPISTEHAHDLWLVLSDPAVAASYGNEPNVAQVQQTAAAIGQAWQRHGVHKWMAYDRDTGVVVGRGGCSRVPVDADWGRLYPFLPHHAWVRQPHRAAPEVHANWVEIGWALRRPWWGHGYATEIGQAGLDFAFGILGVRAVVACTEPDNHRSRTVMERLGMRHAGDIGDGAPPVDGVADNTPYTVHILCPELDATDEPAVEIDEGRKP